jgi:hypothetical protein
MDELKRDFDSGLSSLCVDRSPPEQQEEECEQPKLKSLEGDSADNCCGYLQRVTDAPFIPFPTSRRRYRTPFHHPKRRPKWQPNKNRFDCQENYLGRSSLKRPSSRGTVIAIPRPGGSMKKVFAIMMSTAMLAAMAVPSFAQGRSCRANSTYQPYQTRRNVRTYYDNSRVYDNRAYYDYGYRDRSFWQRHRDKLTLAAGTGAGAAIGGLIGGSRGAAIGALSGLGASALYTYKLRNRRYRY